MPFLTPVETVEQRIRAAAGCPVAMVRLAAHFDANNYTGDAAHFLERAFQAGGLATAETASVAQRCAARLSREALTHYAKQ